MTPRKYLQAPEAAPRYGPRAAQPGKLDPHKPYLEDLLKAGVCNAEVLLGEIRQELVLARWEMDQFSNAHRPF